MVFSQFTTMLDILASELDKNKIGHLYLSGKTKKRQELVNDFNNNTDKQGHSIFHPWQNGRLRGILHLL